MNFFDALKLLSIFSASLLHLALPYRQLLRPKTSTTLRQHSSTPNPVPCREVSSEFSALEQRYLLMGSDALSQPLDHFPLGQEGRVSQAGLKKTVSANKKTRGKLPPLTIDIRTYENACIDRFSRTPRNPLIASHALIIENQAYFYTPPVVSRYQFHHSDDRLEIGWPQPYQIPEYAVLTQIYDSSAEGQYPKYIGRTKCGLVMYGTHVLELSVYSPYYSKKIPAKLVSFYPLDPLDNSPTWGFQETIAPLFSFPNWSKKIKELSSHLQKQLFSHQSSDPKKHDPQKPFTFRVVDDLKIDLKSVCERKKMPRRKPSQKSVMGHSSSQEMLNLLSQPLAQSLNSKIRNFISSCVSTYRDAPEKAEWLHLVGFGCTPVWLNPQTSTNLVASSTSLNTEQMITESILQCLGQRALELGYQNDDLRLSIKNSFFELVPTTHIASYMSYNTRIELTSTRRAIETHQQYASLQPIPVRHKVDVGAACVIFSSFLEGRRPCHQTKVQRPLKKP